MKIKYYKKICLLGILFLMYFGINTITTTFAQEWNSTKCYDGNTCPTICKIDDLFPCTPGKSVGCNCPIADCNLSESDIKKAIEKTSCSKPETAYWNVVECKAKCACGDECVQQLEKEDGNYFYNTLNSIYTTGTGFVSGLLSKSGMDEYKVIVDIPCDNAITKIIGGADCNATKKYKESVPLYVARLYQFGFGIVGVIALLMIIYGAAQYTLSAGGLQTEDAKEIIQNALYGLLLLFAAYLILYTINPGLVSIKAPTLTPVNVENFLVSKQIKPTTSTTGNTPTETTGTNIDNCKIATQPPTVICTECNIGYEFVAASKKCEPCSSGKTYSISEKMCLDCKTVATDINKLDITKVSFTDYYPNVAKDCTIQIGNKTTNPIPGIAPLIQQPLR